MVVNGADREYWLSSCDRNIGQRAILRENVVSSLLGQLNDIPSALQTEAVHIDKVLHFEERN